MTAAPQRSFINRCLRDAHGRLVVIQAPNLPILIALAAVVLARIGSESWQHWATMVSFGAFFTWAWLEIIQGVNYFRRALGAVIMAGLLIRAFH